MGFNNGGMERAARHLAARRGQGIVGINIGANKDSAERIADYRAAFERLAPLADYVTVNISSPNTPGLRGLQNKDELSRLLGTLMEARTCLPPVAKQQEGEVPVATRSRGEDAATSKVAKGGGGIPILVKIAPDLDQAALDQIAAVALLHRLDGLIVSNTTIARPPLQSPHFRETGGLSGAPLRDPSTAILRGMRQRVGNGPTLIGVGGIASGADAYAKIRAGATLVQLYTALVYQGPGLVGRIKAELAECLTRDGYDTVAEAVGADA
jgi:dihydroorotate dehydrogenase